ncbi:MAG: PhzF family phenazine biosynthesis protein [Microthrixaceae bacterium]
MDTALMDIPLFQVDAFTDRPFAGNPAAVCPLESWLPEALMQSIAAENNLSETAFLVRVSTHGLSESGTCEYELRWFTPTTEVDLCGHATLASGHVVLNRLDPDVPSVSFSTRSGVLQVERDTTGVLRMQLPADPRSPIGPDQALRKSLQTILGVEPRTVLGGSTWIAVLESARDVVDVQPDLAALAAMATPYLNVTAPGEPDSGVDFVSRYFAPGAGIDEDPVTGSAHCALTPYWAARLGKPRLQARQVSSRGGELDCELEGDTVVIRGSAVEVLSGTLRLPAPIGR